MSRSVQSRRAGLLLTVLLTATGCTAVSHAASSEPTASTTPAPTSGTPTARTPGTSSALPEGTITLEPVQTFTLGKRRSGSLAVTPKAAFISASPRGGDRPGQLLRLDLSSGEQSQVAGSHWKGGEIDSVAASGDWVVWEDQSDALSLGSPGGSITVQWRVWAKNLKSGRRILLDTSGSAAGPIPPVLVSGDGYVGWNESSSAGALLGQMVWKVGEAHAQSVPLDLTSGRLEHFFGASAIADAKLIFELPANTKLGRKWGAGDCWSYPIDGKGKPQRLTRSGLVAWCSAGGADLVWTEMSATPKNADPQVLKTMSLDGTSGRRTIHEGHMWTRPLVGNDFALWFSGKPTNVSALGSTASTTFQGGSWVWQGAAGGDLLAYPSGSKRVTITVDRVVVSAP